MTLLSSWRHLGSRHRSLVAKLTGRDLLDGDESVIPMTTDMDSTERDDEIALSRFEERLRLRLGDAHRRIARRSLRVGLGGIAAAAAAVLAVAAVACDEDPALAMKVIAATEDAAEDSIVHVSTDYQTAHDLEIWADDASTANRILANNQDGTPAIDSSSSENVTRYVDYCLAQYSEAEGTSDGSFDASWIERLQNDGQLVDDATEVVDGRELIRLKYLNPPQPETTHDFLGFVYVDPETYLAVQMVGYPGTSDEFVDTYQYLPRTAENLALLDAPVPADFTLVDELSPEGGCD